jgi:uncharacterized protein GlcG (DUF336 family)
MRTLTTLTLHDALEIQGHLLYAAENDGLKPVAICIVDIERRVLTSVAMDGTKKPSIDTARDKAITALDFERDTVEFRHVRGMGNRWVPADEVASGEEKLGWSEVDIMAAIKVNNVFVPWAGGVLIRSPHDNSILGAVGVSNRKELEDHDLAFLRPSGWAA